MADIPQSYDNHTRWHAPFHFFLAPVLLTNVIVAIVQLVRDPGLDRGWWLVVSIALVVLAALVRLNPLKAQDRIIRLEESLRYYQLLPEELAQRAASLTPAQTVALRFAPDEELEGLVREVLDGRLTKPGDIKRAIKGWRADTLRV
ncbi:MAG: hypothetical protein QOH49_1754 [Acidobacteriota bacterium]|nr:hypothetical protein [Acidobacteriota bacterium]